MDDTDDMVGANANVNTVVGADADSDDDYALERYSVEALLSGDGTVVHNAATDGGQREGKKARRKPRDAPCDTKQ